MKKFLRLLQVVSLLTWLLAPSTGMAQGIVITAEGSIVITGAASIEINNGSLVNNGTYTKGTETVTFSGTTASTISGTQNIDLNNLSVTNKGGITTQVGLLTTNNISIASECEFIIDPGKAVTAIGTITNGAGTSGLVIRSESDLATGTGSLINSTSAVSATVERWMTGSPVWHLISPSATGQTVSDFVGVASNNSIAQKEGSRFGLAPYNESNDTWTYYAHPTAVGSLDAAGKGYEVLRTSNGTVSFKGVLAAADQAVPIVKTVKGWNLVGNPYPCALDISLFLSNATNSAAIDASYLAVYVVNLANNSYVAVNNTTSPPLKLAPGEGFFVKSKALTGNVSFTTTMKSHTSSAFKSATSQQGIELVAENGTENAITQIRYIGGTSIGLDPGWDAGQFNSNPASFAIFTRLLQDNGVNFMLQCLPPDDYENMVVPVGLTAKQGATVTFKLGTFSLPGKYKVYLEDKLTKKFTRIDEPGSFYRVELAAESNGTGRFFLHTNTGITAPEDKLNAEILIIPLPGQDKIRISGLINPPAQAFVYDMNGRIVTSTPLDNSIENEIPLQGISSGFYLVQIRSAKETTRQKIIWSN